MKKSIIMAVCLLIFTACSKKQNPTTPGQNNNVPSAPNSVILNIGGTSYEAKGGSVGTLTETMSQVSLVTHKDNGKASIGIHVQSYSGEIRHLLTSILVQKMVMVLVLVHIRSRV